MKTFFVAAVAALVGSLLSLTLAGQAQTAKTPSAVAYVSTSRVLSESVAGRAAASRLQTTQTQRTTELRTKQQALETTRQQVATAADGAARQTLQQKEIQERTDFERSTAQFQIDLQNLQREINTDLMRRVKTALDDLMKNQPYQVVLNNDSSVLWAAPELDMTNAVVGRMNSQAQ
jgi:Skp family chaperone for outer membrane proteins